MSTGDPSRSGWCRAVARSLNEREVWATPTTHGPEQSRDDGGALGPRDNATDTSELPDQTGPSSRNRSLTVEGASRASAHLPGSLEPTCALWMDTEF